MPILSRKCLKKCYNQACTYNPKHGICRLSKGDELCMAFAKLLNHSQEDEHFCAIPPK